jgi:hypothetical protein
VHFHEVGAVGEIPERLRQIIESFDLERRKCRDNITRMLEMLHPGVIGREWDATYQALLQRA